MKARRRWCAVAARLGINRGTATKWRARFLRNRLDGLSDGPRPGVPRTSPTSRSAPRRPSQGPDQGLEQQCQAVAVDEQRGSVGPLTALQARFQP
ncbi:helix-turn-helix domain-containing protein [Streptomyces sp. MUM 178J]|uniref:helix-turn-helix domain-containing protein n=1 Tax=Streptomyces sp. MUM 178J TaxID=2791991 RepID=UPI0023D918ED|nr:helix-turn-helix domain-containing protein [Streptomyces sp. MUM 178J]WRQ83075.1 helix-turn-helix domain-containing protein [Streptomyces sp. MUM 178J]